MTMQPTKVLVWNVPGLNAPTRRNAVFQVCLAANPGIICLQETKLENVSATIVTQCLGNRFDLFFYLPATGTRGGILLAWDPLIMQLSNPHYMTNTVTALVQPLGSSAQWWITGVYGPHQHEDKDEFLQELAEIRYLHAGPWAVMGDFNLIVNLEDKSNTSVNQRMMARFRARLNDLELKEIYLNGQRYIWSNERGNATLEKIDHVFTTAD